MASPQPKDLNLQSRRTVLASAAALGVAGLSAQASAQTLGLKLSGRYQQSGFAIGRAAPRAGLVVNGKSAGRASADGLFIVGFDRDEPSAANLTATLGDGSVQHQFQIEPVAYDVQRINGLPQDQVTPTNPALLARIAEEARRKAIGFSSNIDEDYFKTGFVMPVKGARLSARFGGQRVLNGVPERPHYGSDLAAPIGTTVAAPCDALVCFAETGLHYEGGLILLDHGQGLISAYLHLSKVGVTQGQRVGQGEKIGEVGKEGRATGPHLCWRMKWQGRNMDPLLMVGARAPA